MNIGDVEQDFGALVRQARESRQMTQAELAQQLSQLLNREVRPLVVTRIESGKRPTPLDELAALARLLNLELDPLLNPAPVRSSSDELVHRIEQVRGEINEMHQNEVRLMAEYASVQQQLRAVRTRKDELERELQALEREARKESGGEQEHQEEAER
ncbi:multiprotein-bridging factor 1 family protein [Streptomyces murinus]|uniref:multiprotein-bridging factor 1 family protein n=1 Tax=Streptomyces murinus TaxID=33900 RepID=UPI0037AEBACB